MAALRSQREVSRASSRLRAAWYARRRLVSLTWLRVLRSAPDAADVPRPGEVVRQLLVTPPAARLAVHERPVVHPLVPAGLRCHPLDPAKRLPLVLVPDRFSQRLDERIDALDATAGVRPGVGTHNDLQALPQLRPERPTAAFARPPLHFSVVLSILSTASRITSTVLASSLPYRPGSRPAATVSSLPQPSTPRLGTMLVTGCIT